MKLTQHKVLLDAAWKKGFKAANKLSDPTKTKLAQAIVKKWMNHHYGENLNGWYGTECRFCLRMKQQHRTGADLPTTVIHKPDCVVLLAEKVLS